MESRSKAFLVFLLFLFVVGLGVTTGAREQPIQGQESSDVASMEEALVEPDVSAELEVSEDPEPVCSAEPQAASAASDSAGFGFTLCTSQAHCESLCAPFGGFCFRQICICD